MALRIAILFTRCVLMTQCNILCPSCRCLAAALLQSFPPNSQLLYCHPHKAPLLLSLCPSVCCCFLQ
jgi:hypothetical protein